MAPVEKRPKGLSPLFRAQLLYRAPLASYYFFAIMMILLTWLAFGSTPNAQGTDLVMSPTVEAQMASIKEHAAVSPAGTKRPFYPQVFLFHLTNGLYHLGLYLGMNFAVIQAICCAAWVAHVAEATHAFRLCKKAKGSKLTTAVYVVVTFIGGFGQLVTLKQAVSRYEEELEKRSQ
jgi:hypothetical protein